MELTDELFDLHTGFDHGIYESKLNSLGAWSRFLSLSDADPKRVLAAFDLALAIYDAADAAAPADAAFMVYFSGGKDSTLALSLWIQYQLARKSQGLPLRRTIISTANTGVEFPEVANRMYDELAAIKAWAASESLPIETIIAKPDLKNRLYVQICGKGRALPALSKSATGAGGSANWCVDYLKLSVGKKAQKAARELSPTLITVLGTRLDESTRRKQSMTHYSEGLSAGLTSTAYSQDGDIGITPIAYIDDSMLRSWLYDNMAAARKDPALSATPWRPESLSELVRIYRKAGAGSDLAGECSLVATKDGSVASVCGDLSGVRMGCATCLKVTKNKSLANFSLVDPRYRALQAWHQEAVALRHDDDKRRRTLRDGHNFSKYTLVPKGLTFRERYRLLVLLFAAELESHSHPDHGPGFTLIDDDELEMISFLWKRSGVFNIEPHMAREDAVRYLKTGDMVFSWEYEEFDQLRFMKVFSEGLPMGAWFSRVAKPLVNGSFRFNDLEWHNLLAFASSGIGSPASPTLLAYLLRDRRDSDRVIVYVTDCPTSIGHPTNTKLLNGYMMAAWKVAGVREVTDWEREMSKGRSFFYALNLKTQSIVRAGGDEVSFVPSDIKWADLIHSTEKALYTGCSFEDAFADYHSAGIQLAEIKDKVDQDTMTKAMELVSQGVTLSEYLENEIGSRSNRLQSEFNSPEYWDHLESIQYAFGVDDTEARTLSPVQQNDRKVAIAERKQLFRQFRARVKEILAPDAYSKDIAAFIEISVALSELAASGKANYALFTKLAEITQYAIYDPDYAAEKARDLADYFGVDVVTPGFASVAAPITADFQDSLLV